MAFEDEPPYRQIYARQILAKAGVAKNDRLLAALAKVPREKIRRSAALGLQGLPPLSVDGFHGSGRTLSGLVDRS
jgi:hypothetical protein